jgi:hypothetical protein
MEHLGLRFVKSIKKPLMCSMEGSVAHRGFCRLPNSFHAAFFILILSLQFLFIYCGDYVFFKEKVFYLFNFEAGLHKKQIVSIISA